jgi:CHAT domain-containing protein
MAVPLAVAQVSPFASNFQSQQDVFSLLEQGKKRYQSGQFAEAAALWQTTADLFAAQGDSLNQAIALSNLSLSYQSLGQWDNAQQSLTTGVHLLQTQPKTPQQQRIFASTLDIQGQFQLATGQAIAALETWRQSTEIYRQIDEPDQVSRSQINQAQALQTLGLYPRSCLVLLKTLGHDRRDCILSPSDLQTLTTPPSESLQILALQSLGNVLRALDKSDQSQLALVKSLQLAKKSNNSQYFGEIYLGLANTVRALGNRQLITKSPQPNRFTFSADCTPSEQSTSPTGFYGQAVACYQQAELSVLPITKIQAQLNRLSLGIETQKWTELEPLLTEIAVNLPKINTSQAKINAQLKYVQLLTCLRTEVEPIVEPNLATIPSPLLQQCSHLPSALSTSSTPSFPAERSIPSWQNISQFALEAYQQSQALGDKKLQANALGYLASTYKQRKDWTQAQKLTEQALQLLSAFNAPDLTYLWQWQLGQLYQIQGDLPSAIASYTLALDNLQSLRQDLVSVNRELQFSFRDSIEPVYRELVDLLLQGNNPSQENLKAARNVLESLQIAELNNFFREACLEEKPQAIDRFDPQAAIFYSIVLPNRLAVILSLPGQPLRYYATPVDLATVELTFDDLSANLNLFFASSQPLKSNQQFYDWLIRPAIAQLKDNGIKTLVFVLDGVLRNVPLAALFDGHQYLIEQYNLALTPSLQLFSPRTLALDNQNTLAGGLAESRQGFSPLPGVQQEFKEISNLVPTEVLINQEFTRDRLKQSIKASSFPIVHLATHGQFSSQAENTFLLTWDERINVKDLDQLLQERNPIELLILSACQTAVGDKRATLGLAGIAVRARARSTIATLWSIQDQSTADLMAKFYSIFKRPGVTKAEALRQAQLTLLKDKRYQHPFYWAAFVLVGNWL